MESTQVSDEPAATTINERLVRFFQVKDERFEDYGKQPKAKLFIRDFLAALIVSLVAIPLGVGFSIASGMRPEQGIIAGAIAGVLGGIFGGSKYQVYGPTAAFITVIASVVLQFGVPFLIMSSMLAGGIILLMGVLGLGKYFRFIPHSIIVGFTIGIAGTIIVTQLPDAVGGSLKISLHTFEKITQLPRLIQDANAHAMILAILTFYLIRVLYRFSVFIPAPLIAIVLGSFIANVIWHDKLIPLISSKYGEIGQNMFQFTPPSLNGHKVTDLLLPVLGIVFIASLESLLSSRMADRLANNPTPYNPDKELFGQGVVNALVPLLNGFPCTGALARTATSIKVGAVSPFASIMTGGWVIMLMLFFSSYLGSLPMACVSGLLILVACNMVKPEEVKSILLEGKGHVFLMAYTAIMTIATDLMIAVSTATVIYFVARKFAPPLFQPSNTGGGMSNQAAG